MTENEKTNGDCQTTIRRRRKRSVLSDQKWQKLEEQFLNLRKEGLSFDEIAQRLTVSRSSLSQARKRLIERGEMKPYSYRVNWASACWRNLNNKRVKTIIEMVKQRRTLKEIARAIGVTTRERARQLVAKITETHGEKVFEPKEAFLTTQEAANMLGVSTHRILKIIANGDVTCKKRSTGARSAWHIEKSEIGKLQKHPLITGKCKCVTCGKIFIRHNTKRLTCSDKCRKKRRWEQRVAFGKQNPIPESLRGWQRNLLKKLQNHHLPKDEKWLTFTQANEITGLSRMQFFWLKYRNIITTRHHPRKKTKNGKPTIMFAKSEMEIIRELFAAQVKNGNN